MNEPLDFAQTFASTAQHIEALTYGQQPRGFRQRLAKWIGGRTVTVNHQTVQVVSPVASEAAPPRQGDIPLRWSNSYFPPGRPITPLLTTYQQALQEYEPRTFQYPPNVNATIAPRLGYGLTPFYQLKYFAENVPELGMCRRILTEELKNFIPQLVHTGDETPVDVSEECPELEWMVRYPDRKTPWPVWLSRLLYNLLVYDAPGIYNIFDRSGQIVGRRIIDGSTLFVLIDDNGEAPALPAPSIVQIYYGAPRAWMNSKQMTYLPRHLRADAPYGISPIEDCLRAVELLDKLWSYELSELTEGNTPEVLVSGPPDWPPEKLLVWESNYNSVMAGSPEQRMRMRFIPNGFTKLADRNHQWSPERYDAALERVGYVHGVPPSEMGKIPGRGLGGKGFEDAMQSQFYRMGIGPLKMYMEGSFNDVLALNGYDKQYKWELAFPQVSMDPDAEHEKALEDWQVGITTMDEARSDTNRDETESPYGKKFYFEVMSKAAGQEGAPGEAALGQKVAVGRKVRVRNGDGVSVVNRHGTVDVKPATIQVGHDGQVRVQLDKAENVHKEQLHKAVQDIPGLRHAYAEEVGVADCEHCQFMRQFGSNGDTTYFCWRYDSKVQDDWTCVSWLKAASHPDAIPLLEQPGSSIETYAHGEPVWPVDWPVDQEVDKADELHEGAMVALYLDSAAASTLHTAVEGWPLPAGMELEDAEDYHVTLAFFEDAEEVRETSVLAAMQSGAFKIGPLLNCKVSGLGVFNQPDGRRCLYASIDGPDLPVLRQILVEELDARGVAISREHGFTPHVTLAYLPEDFTAELDLTDMVLPTLEITFDGFTLTIEDDVLATLTFGEGYTRLGKSLPSWQAALLQPLSKHCGVCEGDEAFFGAPVEERLPVMFPKQGANETRIVAIRAHGVMRPALWKPSDQEDPKMRREVGGDDGTMAAREEAAYVLDQALGFHLVPVAYQSTVRGQSGAVLHYVSGRGVAKPVVAYSEDWLEKSAVLDYIMGQTDRAKHNWLTHPDEGDRPVLIDNGLSFPGKDTPRKFDSAFVAALPGHALSESTWQAVDALCDDATLWEDITDCVGTEPANLAHERACELRDKRALPAVSTAPVEVKDAVTTTD